MAKTKQTRKPATPAARPQGPVVVRNETAAMDVAVERKRPVVAINEDGKMVVCSRRTAAKYGWELQGKLYSRSTGTKQTKPAVKEAATAAIAQVVRRAVRAEFAAQPRSRK